MTICKSTCKKTNHFEELGESDAEHKVSDLIEPSSLTGDSHMKTTDGYSELKDLFLAFQQSTNNQFCQIELSFQQVTESISDLRNLIVNL